MALSSRHADNSLLRYVIQVGSICLTPYLLTRQAWSDLPHSDSLSHLINSTCAQRQDKSVSTFDRMTLLFILNSCVWPYMALLFLSKQRQYMVPIYIALQYRYCHAERGQFGLVEFPPTLSARQLVSKAHKTRQGDDRRMSGISRWKEPPYHLLFTPAAAPFFSHMLLKDPLTAAPRYSVNPQLRWHQLWAWLDRQRSKGQVSYVSFFSYGYTSRRGQVILHEEVR